MNDPIDGGLSRLRQSGARIDLEGLETAVWTKVDAAQGDIFRGHLVSAQIGAAAAALLLGLAIAQFTGGHAVSRSETIVLSDDSGLAPSVRLEGGV